MPSLKDIIASDPSLKERAERNRKQYEADVSCLERWAGTGFSSTGFVSESLPMLIEEETL